MHVAWPYVAPWSGAAGRGVMVHRAVASTARTTRPPASRQSAGANQCTLSGAAESIQGGVHC